MNRKNLVSKLTEAIKALEEAEKAEAKVTTAQLPKEKLCPKCSETRPLSDFGIRFYRGEPKAQSYCKSCRTKAGMQSYYKKR